MTMVNNVIEVLNYVIAARPYRSIPWSLTHVHFAGVQQTGWHYQDLVHSY